MNPTIAQAKELLGIKSKAGLARFLGITRQSMTGHSDHDPMLDGWCWTAAKHRPDLFAPVVRRTRKRGS